MHVRSDKAASREVTGIEHATAQVASIEYAMFKRNIRELDFIRIESNENFQLEGGQLVSYSLSNKVVSYDAPVSLCEVRWYRK